MIAVADFAVLIPFYANGLRGDQLGELLQSTARHAVRFGAVRTSCYRSQEDAYSFQLVLHFEDKADWLRYWHSDEFVATRTRGGSWFQKPLAYEMHEILVDEVAPGRHGAEASAMAPAAAPATTS